MLDAVLQRGRDLLAGAADLHDQPRSRRSTTRRDLLSLRGSTPGATGHDPHAQAELVSHHVLQPARRRAVAELDLELDLVHAAGLGVEGDPELARPVTPRTASSIADGYTFMPRMTTMSSVRPTIPPGSQRSSWPPGQRSSVLSTTSPVR